MSQFGGKKKENKNVDFEKYVGFLKADVVAINPDRDELNKLLGKESTEEDKEIEYTGDKEGVDFTKLSFWLRADGEENIHIPYTVVMRNQVRRNREGDKIQLINSVGDTTWVEADNDDSFDETQLFDSFKHFLKINSWVMPDGSVLKKWKKGAKANPEDTEILGDKTFRPALVGEEEVMNFVKDWLSALDLRDPDTTLMLDTKKIFANNVKAFTEQIGGDFAKAFVALAYVSVDEEDPEKQYQRIFKRFLPQNFLKFIAAGCKFPNEYATKTWTKFIEEVNGEYGVKGFYVLEPLKLYNPEDDFATSTDTKVEESAATSTSKY